MRATTVAVLAMLVSGLASGRRLQGQQAADTALVRGRDDTKAQRLFGELMSPYCPGLTIATCPSPGADSLREDIRARLDRGETPRAIRASYVADWGERVLGAPPLREWGVLLWFAPGVLLVFGLVALTLWLRTLRPTPDAACAGAALPDREGPSPADQALRERLEEELRAFDRAG